MEGAVEFANAARWWIAAVCLSALGIILIGAAVVYAKRHGRWFLEKAEWVRKNPSCLLAMPLVVALFLYGSEKQRIMFSFGKNLQDNGSWATNDTVCAKWLYDTRPGTDMVNIAYREYGSGNDYTLIAKTPANDYIWQGTILNAANYDYKIYFDAITPDADKETFVAQVDLTVDGERMVPYCVDISVDGNGVFDFIKRPAWPTNVIESAATVELTLEDIEAMLEENVSTASLPEYVDPTYEYDDSTEGATE